MLRIFTHAILPFAAFGITALVHATPAATQQGYQTCISQGHKPGSNGFYRCLQSLRGSGADSSAKKGTAGSADSIISGSSDDAVGGYTGGPIEGASNPDPDLLKQLEKDDLTPSGPGGRKP
jgi:hypothetical protein